MFTPTLSRRAVCALLALVATVSLHGLWLGGMDRDAAVTIGTLA